MPNSGAEDFFNSPITALGIGLLTSRTPQEGLKAGMGLLSANAERKRQEQLNKLQQMKLEREMAGGDNPANVKEWEYYNKLTPEQQKAYLGMKRAQQTINLGGSQAVLSPLGGIAENYPVTPKPDQMPDFMAAQERSKVIGKSGGEAQVNLPGAEAQGQEAINLIDEIIKHPGMSDSVGVKNPTAYLNFGDPIPGTDAAGFKSRVDQMLGKQFLQAFESLKGGGQITEVEGTKATNAIARMGTAQSEKEFVAAAEEFKSIVKAGMERAKMKAAPPNAYDVFVGAEGAMPAELPPPGQPKRLKFNRATGRLE